MRTLGMMFGVDGLDERFLGFAPEEIEAIREQFVQGRFAEDKFFGRPDIEQWFRERERRPIEESEVGLWKKLLGCSRSISRRFGELSDDEAIRRYGARYRVDVNKLPEDFYERESGSAMNTHIDQMIASGLWEVYVGDGVTCFEKSSGLMIVFEHAAASGCGTWRLHHVETLHPLFLAREFGKHGRARAADLFLRQTLGRCIKSVHAKAEEDFSGAVAVSPDGQIVKAEEVWIDVGAHITDPEARIKVYPASFIDSTIFLSSDYERISGQFPASIRETGLRYAEVLRTQHLASVGGKSVFLTPLRYVPRDAQLPGLR